jgi:DNA mismatch repair ATPase MutS
MKRFWDVKKENMDKILFWRFGDWYVLYYQDLSICARYLDLAIPPMPGST